MTMSKHAGWTDFFKKTVVEGIEHLSKFKTFATNPYTLAAVTPIIGAGVDAGIGQVRKMMTARHKAKAYKGMLKENPILAKKPPKQTQKFFNTLYNSNPELARDPLVASSWVHTQMEQQIPGVPHAGVVEGVSALTKIRQQMRGPGGARGPGTFQGLGKEVGRSVTEAHGAKVQDKMRQFRADKAEAEKAQKGLQEQMQRNEAHKNVLNERIEAFHALRQNQNQG